MIEEQQLINHWLQSKDVGFLRKLGLDRSYFFPLRDVVEWIENIGKKTGSLPSVDTVAVEFENFRKLTDLDPIEYLVEALREQKIYSEYRPVLIASAELLNEGKSIEAVWKMKADVEKILKIYTPKMTHTDWVKDANKRFDRYLETHGREGLCGLTTGIKGLDDATGGWRNDDLILLAARLNEGKSFLGSYFAYVAWKSLEEANINDPVIFITTEMPELEIAYRLDTLRAHFSNRALYEGNLPDPELYREYCNELSKKNNSFFILSQEANGGRQFTPNDILAIIESEHPAFLVIDQLYDLSDGTGERDIRKRIVSVTQQIRDINLRTQTPTLLIAQAGRESEKDAKKDPNATPELFQVQESDNPAQKATRAITLRMINNDIFKISLKKNRGGPKNLDFYMHVDLDTGIWEETQVETLVF